MHLPYIGETERLDKVVRGRTPGHFIELTQGQTHYRILGPDDGRLVILVHGIAGPMGIWELLAQALAESGFRVLYYDLFGRGHSDRPVVRYDIDLFTTQLRQLLSKLSSVVPFALVGWSLGGIITASWVAENPAWTGRLILIAPAGVEVSLPLISRVGMVPILGDIIMAAFGRRIVLQSLMRGLYRDDIEKEFLSLVEDTHDTAFDQQPMMTSRKSFYHWLLIKCSIVGIFVRSFLPYEAAFIKISPLSIEKQEWGIRLFS